MVKHAYVYMLASGRYGTLYIGVTSNLVQRIWQHREGLVDGFTKKYGVKLLVWYEVHEDIYQAITREKRLKEWKREWKREWKLRLIHEKIRSGGTCMVSYWGDRRQGRPHGRPE